MLMPVKTNVKKHKEYKTSWAQSITWKAEIQLIIKNGYNTWLAYRLYHS